MNPTSDPSPLSNDQLFRLLAVGFLALIASTWPLWTPQSAFPQVPLFEAAGRLPVVAEWILLGTLLSLQGFLLIAPGAPYRRLVCVLTIACTLSLVCVDQHRLQPWTWEFVIVLLVLNLADAVTVRAAWRWIVIGIYAWSAWSKFDYGFTQQHGPFLLDGLLRSLGVKAGIQVWSPTARTFASAAIPCAELSIAVALAWPRTRRWGVYGAALMHLTLLMALGPWGHNHQPGVLLWNVFFLVQNAVLFRQPIERPHPRAATECAARSLPAPIHWGNRLALTAIALVMIWPAFEPIGLCDHWPAWSVYAAKLERVTVCISDDEQSELPESFQHYLGGHLVAEGWTPVRIDRWSLDTVRCPIYPQDRFQVGVALGMAERFHLSKLRIVIESPADRRTGRRETRTYEGLDSILALANTYRLGAHSRPPSD